MRRPVDHADHVAHAVETLLKRELSFDDETREIFWSTHIEKVAMWRETWVDALSTFAFEASDREVAILNRTLDELKLMIPVARRVEANRARRNPSALRALVFSNVIAYIATAYPESNDIPDQWNIYQKALEILDVDVLSAPEKLSVESAHTKVPWTTDLWEDDRMGDGPPGGDRVPGRRSASRSTGEQLEVSGGQKLVTAVIWIIGGFIVAQVVGLLTVLVSALMFGADPGRLYGLIVLATWIWASIRGYQSGLNGILSPIKRAVS